MSLVTFKLVSQSFARFFSWLHLNIHVIMSTQRGRDTEDAGVSIEEIVQGISSQDAHQQLIAAQNARKILSREPCPPTDAMIASGVVPILVQFLLRHDNVPLQFEACWALANITSGNFAQRRTVVEAGAIPNFTSLLSSPHANVAEKAVCALRNIAGDDVYLRDLVIRSNIIPPLHALLTSDISPLLRRTITGILSKLCINENSPPPFHVIKMVLPTLAELINHSDKEVVRDSLFAISYLTEGSYRERQEVINLGLVPRLCELLEMREVSIISPALNAIGHIISVDDEHVQTMINAGALQTLRVLLRHPVNFIVEDACWIVFFTAGTPTQIQAVIDNELVGLVIDVLHKGAKGCQKEAIWAVKSITTYGTIEQIIFLVKAGVIPPVCNLLAVKDPEILAVALETIDNILNATTEGTTVGTTESVCCVIKQCGGLDIIENLLHHEDPEVYKLAFTIIDSFFTGEVTMSTQCRLKYLKNKGRDTENYRRRKGRKMALVIAY
nr:importin subunit alpha-1 isoform X1 [Parasteatoda tepidariorum]